MRIFAIIAILQLVTGCASDTVARSFKPKDVSISSDHYKIDLSSGYEITSSSTSVLFIPTGYTETYERILERTIYITITPKGNGLNIDLSKFSLQSSATELKYPVRAAQFEGKPWNHTILREIDQGSMTVSITRTPASYSLDFNTEGLNIDDEVTLKLGGISSGKEKLPDEIIKLKEGTIRFQRQ